SVVFVIGKASATLLLNLLQSTEPVVKREEQYTISSSVPGYFTSSDVYHAYKQPVQPMNEQKDSTTIIDKATSIITDIITSVADALPITKTTEEPTTTTTESHVSDEVLSVPTVTQEQEVDDQQEASSDDLVEIMK
ncbi:unnamed protein product, partial [Adineta steineri]